MKTLCILLVVALGVTLISKDSQPTSTQLRWAAALNGDANAQFEVGEVYQQQQRVSAALIWWQRAAQNGSKKALERLQSLRRLRLSHLRRRTAATGRHILYLLSAAPRCAGAEDHKRR